MDLLDILLQNKTLDDLNEEAGKLIKNRPRNLRTLSVEYEIPKYTDNTEKSS